MGEFKKLVRDKIPGIIRKNRQIPVCRKLGRKEFRQALVRKLQEEVGEFLVSRTRKADELVDIVEVVLAFAKYYGLDQKHLLHLCEVKRKKNGSFSQRIFLESVADSKEEAEQIKSLPKENKEEIRKKVLSALKARMEEIMIIIPPYGRCIAPTNEFSQSEMDLLLNSHAIEPFGTIGLLLEKAQKSREAFETETNSKLPPDETACYHVLGQLPDQL